MATPNSSVRYQRLPESGNNNDVDSDASEEDLIFQMGGLEAAGGDQHRKVTPLQALMHLLKANIGTGILAIPNAFINAGLYGGLLSMPLFALVCTHCMHILMSASTIVDRHLNIGMMDYPALCEASFNIGPRGFQKCSKVARFIINCSLIATQFGFCCVYSLFVADTLEAFMRSTFNFSIDVRLYLAMVLPLFVLISQVKSLRIMSFFSATSNVLMSVGFVAILAETFRNMPSVDSVRHFPDISRFPLFMGTAIYAFEGIGVILPLQRDMDDPKKLKGVTGVVNTAMTIVMCLNTGIGFFGFLKYGDHTQPSITLSMPESPFYKSVKLIFAVAITLTYPIQYYVPYNIIWPWTKERYDLDTKLGPNSMQINAIDAGLRALFVTFTFTLAAAIPKLDLFISLVGAFAASFLALIFPPLIDISSRWNEKNQNWSLIMFKNIIIFMIGIIGFSTGTYASIRNIIENYDK